MSDITELFNRVAQSADNDPDPETVEADVTRGRQALARDHRRRTIRRSMAATTTVAAAAVVIVVASQLSGGSSANTTHHGTATPKHSVIKPTTTSPTVVKTHHRITPIKLVDYKGPQLAGFTVDKVPDGWFLGGVNQFALTINPKGDTNTSPDVFEGKLTVLLISKDQSFPTHGTPVTVDGNAGIITDDGGIALYFPDNSGHVLDIQIPNKLDWTTDQMVSFAEGVHVTSNAEQGVG
jgi:hypothetical protein